MAMKDRLRRLESHAPAALGEEEIRAEACRRLSTEDLRTLAETGRHLDEMGAGELDWEQLLGELPEEERAAFDLAYARYEEAVREARVGR